MTNDKSQLVADLLANAASDYIPAPVGGITSALISHYGKRPIQYILPEQSGNVEQPIDPDAAAPDFAVIGMGRCGSHVAVVLHNMISSKSNDSFNERRVNNKNWFNFSLSRRNNKVLEFKPVMLVGDTDETTFADLNELANLSKPSDIVDGGQNEFLKLSYAPLADRGVGQNPIISQFLTRALLVFPEPNQSKDELAWQNAKNFLLSVENVGNKKESKLPPRIAFYIFSAAGGTGCGAASEVLRAQQYATVKETGNALTYYCAVAVLPDVKENETKRILNTGRFIVQYLSEKRIIVNSEDDYTKVPIYEGSSEIIKVLQRDDPVVSLELDINSDSVPTSSWDSVLFVSNSIMDRIGNKSESDALEHANEYIAQQLFNLAGPQMSASSLNINENRLDQKNFDAIRLDAMDLKGALRGPCACCFGVAEDSKERTENDLTWVHNLLIRAISIPQKRPETDFIEGISVLPTDAAEYESLFNKDSIDDTCKGLSELSFYNKAASLVFTLTIPQHSMITATEVEAIINLLSKLFPNISEVRYSIIFGTTPNTTFSLYVEGSVIFAPEMVRSVYDYVNFCWPNARKLSQDDFHDWWDKTLDCNPDIQLSNIIETIGEFEDLTPDYPNLDAFKQTALASWEQLVDNTIVKNETLSFFLKQINFSDFSVNAMELQQALKFYNFYNNRRKRQSAYADRIKKKSGTQLFS